MKASCCDQFARCRRVIEAALCAAVRLFGFDWSRISEVLGVELMRLGNKKNCVLVFITSCTQY